MALPPDLRRTLLELTHRLDRLIRCPRTTIKGDEDDGEVSEMTALAIHTLTMARNALDFDDGPPRAFAYRPKSLPSANIGHLIHARNIARSMEPSFTHRRPRQ